MDKERMAKIVFLKRNLFLANTYPAIARQNTFRIVVMVATIRLFAKNFRIGAISSACTYPSKPKWEGKDRPLEKISLLVLKEDKMTQIMGSSATHTHSAMNR